MTETRTIVITDFLERTEISNSLFKEIFNDFAKVKLTYEFFEPAIKILVSKSEEDYERINKYIKTSKPTKKELCKILISDGQLDTTDGVNSYLISCAERLLDSPSLLSILKHIKHPNTIESILISSQYWQLETYFWTINCFIFVCPLLPLLLLIPFIEKSVLVDLFSRSEEIVDFMVNSDPVHNSMIGFGLLILIALELLIRALREFEHE